MRSNWKQKIRGMFKSPAETNPVLQKEELERLQRILRTTDPSPGDASSGDQ